MNDLTEARLPDLGCEVNHGFDSTGHERRERLEFIGDCPKCGRRVEGWAETEEWTKAVRFEPTEWSCRGHGREGWIDFFDHCPRCQPLKYKTVRYLHKSFGPAAGVCCGLLFVNGFEGMETYKLSEQ